MDVMTFRYTLVCAIVLLSMTPALEGKKSEFKRVCYYSNSAQYRDVVVKFLPKDINATLCDYIIYAFAEIHGNILAPSQWNDESRSWRKGLYGQVTDLKKDNPHLKVLLAIGWTTTKEGLSSVLDSPNNMTTFIKTTMRFLRDRDFDGMDLDFEYRGSRITRAGDKEKYLTLCQNMMAAFIKEGYHRSDGNRLLLTAAVPSRIDMIERAYDPQTTNHVDFINVMSFSLHGAWEDTTGHTSPLYKREGEREEDEMLNLEAIANYWIERGVKKEKIVIGMASYGLGYRLSDPEDKGVGATAVGPSHAGKYTRQAGFLAYYEICDKIITDSMSKSWIPEQEVPYITNGDEWISYDNQTSLQAKVKWLMEKGLGGWMLWSFDMDDFTGLFCNMKKYPLLNALNEALGPDEEEEEEEEVEEVPVDEDEEDDDEDEDYDDDDDDHEDDDDEDDDYEEIDDEDSKEDDDDDDEDYDDFEDDEDGGDDNEDAQGENSEYEYYDFVDVEGGDEADDSGDGGGGDGGGGGGGDDKYDYYEIDEEGNMIGEENSDGAYSEVLEDGTSKSDGHTSSSLSSKSKPALRPTKSKPKKLRLPPPKLYPIPPIPDEEPAYKRVCYYTNWAQYRAPPAKFLPKQLDPSLCTHLIYAFAIFVNNFLKPCEWNDESYPWRKGMYEQFNDLKAINPELKTLLAVGGWTFGTGNMTMMLATKENRTHFIQSAIEYIRYRKFDGLDLDFEYPANRGSPPGDKLRYTLLVKELYTAFVSEGIISGQPRLLLTAAVAAGKKTIETAYEVDKISKYVDFINLMAYDLHGSWENNTGHNAPLYSRKGENITEATLNVNYAAEYWMRLGAPRHKLIIGLGLYARGFTLKKAKWYTIVANTTGPSRADHYTREPGFVAAFEICKKLKDQDTKTVWDKEQQIPYLHNGDQWHGYDDMRSLEIKVQWLRKNRFGGWMVWSIDMDDFSGQFCDKGPYPYMKALNKYIKQKEVKSDEKDDEEEKKDVKIPKAEKVQNDVKIKKEGKDKKDKV